MWTQLAFVLASALVSVIAGGAFALLFFEFFPSGCSGGYGCAYGKALLTLLMGLAVTLVCFVLLLLKGLRKRKSNPPPAVTELKQRKSKHRTP